MGKEMTEPSYDMSPGERAAWANGFEAGKESTKPSPTSEQQACIDAIKSGTGNLIINALAGTGKTTTLDFIQAASPVQPVLCLAFNKSVADEATKRFPGTTTVRTFNSLGHRIWAKTVTKLTFDPKKMQSLLKEELNALKGEDRKKASEAYWEILSTVGMAKSLGYIPEGKFPQAKRLCTREYLQHNCEDKVTPFTMAIVDSLLLRSIKASYEGWIDYNDQIYMPALFGGTFPRFPLVLVDEAQDLNPVNHEMLKKLCKGRVCAVGDPWQSIYGFRGAVVGGMARLKHTFAMSEATISHSFRCPKAVVEAARWRVPGFNWVKEGGHVENLSNLSEGDIRERSAIICRNNAPLLRLAFDLLSAKRSVSVAGSDIGPKLIRIMQKLGSDDTSRAQLLGRIEDWKDEKLASSNSPSTILDMAECMKVFASFGDTRGLAISYAKHLFEQQGTIQLITGHKAKGREWDTVYFLDPWLVGDDEQELNLRYVIQTRSADSLFEIDSRNINWSH